jgi:hypothetical protein
MTIRFDYECQSQLQAIGRRGIEECDIFSAISTLFADSVRFPWQSRISWAIASFAVWVQFMRTEIFEQHVKY